MLTVSTQAIYYVASVNIVTEVQPEGLPVITPLIILTLLVTPLALAAIYAAVYAKPLDYSRYAGMGLGAVFIFAALGHFVRTGPMVDMLPPWVPMRELLVYGSGVLEFVIAGGLLTHRYRKTAAVLAMIVLVVFFPANVYAAIHHTGMGGHRWGPVYLWIRTPLQLILIAWAYWLFKLVKSGD